MKIDPAQFPSPLIRLCRSIHEAGGHTWLVGGSVRDLLLGKAAKDFDLEVYQLEPASLLAVLESFGRVESVGKQFGVYKLWQKGIEIDVALPRREKKTAPGHSGFEISSDPHLSPEQASLRRDFTVNAMMFDPLNAQLLDFHNGIKDLETKQLRHISSAFAEDPLRPLRAMQFCARFALELNADTALLCKSLLPEAASLPKERIWNEWRKWSHADHPSFGLKALQQSGWIDLYPQLATLSACHQDPRWHPEGDVWTHTLLACDMASHIAQREGLNHKQREILLFATLCHDLGKPATTATNEAGHICSPGHSQAGVEPTTSFMQLIGAPQKLIHMVIPLIMEHMTHMHGEPTDRAIRRLAHRLEPANISIWEMLVEADASGRAPAAPSRPALAWLERARDLSNEHQKPQPILTGKTLLCNGIAPGPEMGKMLEKAYQAQLDGEIIDLDSALIWLNRRQ